MCGNCTENQRSDNTCTVNVREYPHISGLGAPADRRQSSTIAARFWSKVDRRGDDDCWPWLACLTGGRYGYIRIDKIAYVAHRIAYELTHGEIPSGLLIRHKCDNTVCCNPLHLEPGTQIDNMQDAITRGRHAAGEGHGRHKLTAAQAQAVLDAPTWKAGALLAVSFGASKHVASDIRHGRSWKSLNRLAA